MAARALLLIAAALLGDGCTPQVVHEPVEVKVPVAVREKPPAELTAPVQVEPLAEFVAPTADGASSCLTEDGEKRLKGTLSELWSRLQEWRAWSNEP